MLRPSLLRAPQLGLSVVGLPLILESNPAEASSLQNSVFGSNRYVGSFEPH